MRVFAIVQGKEYEVDSTIVKVVKGENGYHFDWDDYPINSNRYGLPETTRIHAASNGYRTQIPLLSGGFLVANVIDFRIEPESNEA